MRKTFEVSLASPAHEMAQEEIRKQVAYLAQGIADVRFVDDGRTLSFEAPAEEGPDLVPTVKTLAARIERSLRNLKRVVVYRSPGVDTAAPTEIETLPGVHFTSRGTVMLDGLAFQLFRYFDRTFEESGAHMGAQPLRTPILIPADVLAKCDYFRSFPQYVTFTSHLREDARVIEGFRKRHHDRSDIDGEAFGDMAAPEACLSPAVCYHVYSLHARNQLPAAGLTYGVCGACFRWESANTRDLRRLWNFTMREVVSLGDRDTVFRARSAQTEWMTEFLKTHRLEGEIRTASDPFFVAPDAVGKTYFQLSSETKFEVSLVIPDQERLAVGSINYHTDFFGRVFDIKVAESGFAHSLCMAFGLERWVYAFFVQHGVSVSRWPDAVRRAPELAGW